MLENYKTDIEVLAESRSWSATPWDYNSTVFLQFHADCTGYMCFGYGQRIYAQVNFCFVISAQGNMELRYTAHPGDPPNTPAFQPTAGQDAKLIRYSLKQEATQGVMANGGPFVCDWTLQLDEAPFPENLVLLDLTRLGHAESPPRTYFGYLKFLREGAVAGDRPGART